MYLTSQTEGCHTCRLGENAYMVEFLGKFYLCMHWLERTKHAQSARSEKDQHRLVKMLHNQ